MSTLVVPAKTLRMVTSDIKGMQVSKHVEEGITVA